MTKPDDKKGNKPDDKKEFLFVVNRSCAINGKDFEINDVIGHEDGETIVSDVPEVHYGNILARITSGVIVKITKQEHQNRLAELEKAAQAAANESKKGK